MILIYFDPDIGQEDHLLQEILAKFLFQYAYRNGNNQSLIVSAFNGCVRAVLDAPMGSAMASVDNLKFLKYFVQLTDYEHYKLHYEDDKYVSSVIFIHLIYRAPERVVQYAKETARPELHNELGVKIANEILMRPSCTLFPHNVASFSSFSKGGADADESV